MLKMHDGKGDLVFSWALKLLTVLRFLCRMAVRSKVSVQRR